MTLSDYDKVHSAGPIRNAIRNTARQVVEEFDIVYQDAVQCVESAWLNVCDEEPRDPDHGNILFWGEIQYQVRCLQDEDFPND